MSKNLGAVKATREEQVVTLVSTIVVIILCVTIIVPFWNMFVLAFNDGADTARGGVWVWPREFTFDNFVEVFKDGSIIQAYKITIGRTVLGTALSLWLLTMSAFVLKFRHLPGRNFFSMAIAFTMLFGGGLIPTYIQYYNLGLINTFWIYIFPGCISAWNLIMIRSFFDSLPEALDESAKIDGCNYFRIYWNIVLPLSKPIVAVMLLYCAVGHWNDWFTGSFYQRSKDMWPAQTVLQQMLNRAMGEATKQLTPDQLQDAAYMKSLSLSNVTSESLKMASVVITMTPILCIYPFIQKYFAKGVLVGSIKG